MRIRTPEDPNEKRACARTVLERLTDWFGIEESRERYIRESGDQYCCIAEEDGRYLGFLCLKPTGDATCEIAVTGVLPEYHRRGVGRALFARARAEAKEQGFLFLQVKTVREGVYPEYDATNAFYRACGFREFEVFPMLWDEANPCQIYIMAL